MTKPESHRRPALPALLLWLAVLTCLAPAAQAASRTFFTPKLGGEPIAFCLTATGGCGKAAADHFCRNSGFDTALTFQRRQVMAGGGEEPTGFTQIKCYKPTIEGSSKPTAVTNTAGKSGRLVVADLG
jgi:hypothetical protein